MADLALAGLETIALRVPAHPLAQALLAEFGGAGGGRPRPTAPAMCRRPARRMCWPICAGRIDMVIDGGPSTVGVESTIVACLGEPTLLRPGGVARGDIERVLGIRL